MELKNRVKQLSEDYFREIQEIRHHIHAHPELSFKEYETSKFIQGKLDSFGVSYQNGWAENGVVVLLEGRNPTSRTIALRADIDALPIVEQNEVSYKSKNEGVMHACGHDVHTSSLLGAIKILNELKEEFTGTVKCIFQPAEEQIPGGASILIKEGVLENPNVGQITGQHVYPALEVGKVAFRSGQCMASADEVYITVIGKGGHAAVPREFTDSILITSQIVVGLQQLVARHAPPTVPTVLSFGKIFSEGGATNVIPEKVQIIGTLRTMDENWRAEAHRKIEEMTCGLAKSFGALAQVEIKKGYPFLVNDEQLTEFNRKAAIEYMGADNVVEMPVRLTAEDFAYYSQRVPACFYRLGVANQTKGITSAVHTPTFDIDEEALKTGMGLMSWLAISQLN